MPVAFSTPRSLASLDRSGSFISFSTRMSSVSAACVCSGRRDPGRCSRAGSGAAEADASTAAAGCPLPSMLATLSAGVSSVSCSALSSRSLGAGDASAAAALSAFGRRGFLAGFSAFSSGFSSGGASTALAAVDSSSNSCSAIVNLDQRRSAISRRTWSIPRFVTTEQAIISPRSIPNSSAIPSLFFES